MFYNSLIVGAIIKVFHILNQLYENSFIHKFFVGFSKILKDLSSGSFIVGSFSSKKSIVKYSLLYKIVEKIVFIINIIVEKILGLVTLSKGTSLLMKLADNTAGDFESGLQSVGAILILLGSVFFYLRKFTGLPFLVLGIFIIIIKSKAETAFNNSFTKKIILKVWEIYLPDKEATNGKN